MTKALNTDLIALKEHVEMQISAHQEKMNKTKKWMKNILDQDSNPFIALNMSNYAAEFFKEYIATETLEEQLDAINRSISFNDDLEHPTK